MLILTRRLNEVLCVGPDITIEILCIHGGQVRLGIKAPKDVSVDRREVRARKEAEKAL